MSTQNSEPILVLVTAAGADEAHRLAEALVGSDLAACVQILPPIQSIYRWRGDIERSSEVLLLIKTLRTKFAQLEQVIREMHSYETPEIVALPIIEGSAAYLKWLDDSLT